MKEKGETATTSSAKPAVRRGSDWFDFPDLRRWDFPDLLRWFDRGSMSDLPMRVEEEVQDDSIVIRAEMPGIDPDKDIDITLGDGALSIRAERRKETRDEENGRIRSEFRYGSYTRTVPLPDGAVESDVKASYKDGILEVVVPIDKKTSTQPKKVAVSRS